jgi:hypothetical protein
MSRSLPPLNTQADSYAAMLARLRQSNADSEAFNAQSSAQSIEHQAAMNGVNATAQTSMTSLKNAFDMLKRADDNSKI